MDIDIIELSKGSAKFILSGTNAAFTNGIRRAMIADVPTLAIEYVNLNDNTSVLYDEQIGLRLALVPLITDADYIPQSECTCNNAGCPACEVSLRLDAVGPRMVYSGDFISADPKVQPAEEKIPIVELKDGQRILLEALAHVGYGRDHVRWQAGVACGYKNFPIVTVNHCDACGNCIRECPPKIIQLVGGKAQVSGENILKCTLCRLCERVCELKGDSIHVSYDPASFIFSTESDGSYTSSELVLKAAEVIKGRAQEFSDIIKDL